MLIKNSNIINNDNNNKSIASQLVEAAPYQIKSYLQLIRMDKPIGSWLLFWPCGWSLAMSTTAGSLPSLYYLSLFGFGAFIMRGAGCTINDLWDQDIDSKVHRTKDRPLVTGQINNKSALIFLSLQLSLGLLILLQFNLYTIILGSSSLVLVILYPLMKRITYWPQLILGMTFNWGALLGWSAIYGDQMPWSAAIPLYLAGVCWTIIYDTIYAHQDKIDDVLIGLKSTAIKFGTNTKFYLNMFTCGMLTNLILSGLICEQTWPYYLSLTMISTHLLHQIHYLNINNPLDCANKFKSNQHVGLILFIGIVLGTLFKQQKQQQIINNNNNNDNNNTTTILD
ncbi:4-hydroxybenzoate polyprenyltransferase, mitochondrial [Chrysoperla carnea]|uniref:4-hydroxybenzoate polyprenyltransferase, mitochondrial n=1 Tax=Chrysoperla carnea TaxID=189513 RepID=UPI001D07742F|nr:4-hydroxybenzoate polyprenyltransferase, mitochondrial [Chrysoperla carnea]